MIDVEQAIATLIQFAAENGYEAERGATTVGVSDTFEPVLRVELDDSDRPRLGWIRSSDGQGASQVSLRTRQPRVSYGSKEFERELGVIEERLIG